MTSRTRESVAAVSTEEVELRNALAKALWRDSVGEENLPDDANEREKAFSQIRTDLVKRAIKVERWLSAQGYKVTKV